jgi:hypothetical protein
MDLPKNEVTIHFEHKSINPPNKNYEGKFIVIGSPTIGMRRRIELEKTRLQGDLINPTDMLGGISAMLANLRVRIIDGPEWWKQSSGGEEIQDEDVLIALFDKVMEAETQWRKNLVETAEVTKAPETT